MRELGLDLGRITCDTWHVLPPPPLKSDIVFESEFGHFPKIVGFSGVLVSRAYPDMDPFVKCLPPPKKKNTAGSASDLVSCHLLILFHSNFVILRLYKLPSHLADSWRTSGPCLL